MIGGSGSNKKKKRGTLYKKGHLVKQKKKTNHQFTGKKANRGEGLYLLRFERFTTEKDAVCPQKNGQKRRVPPIASYLFDDPFILGGGVGEEKGKRTLEEAPPNTYIRKTSAISFWNKKGNERGWSSAHTKGRVVFRERRYIERKEIEEKKETLFRSKEKSMRFKKKKKIAQHQIRKPVRNKAVHPVSKKRKWILGAEGKVLVC